MAVNSHQFEFIHANGMKEEIVLVDRPGDEYISVIIILAILESRGGGDFFTFKMESQAKNFHPQPGTNRSTRLPKRDTPNRFNINS